ncbi:L-methionine/branched-chain amino acid transporter [Thalassotalea insulae]|uniref:L-methionine/branched-chain amino acid transporter n=1 Tax=Thalassotalea insulae TaxID=2056778 RepID=A0ABQ6GM62_9GAMM|nr:L-methionine/branched-chain amino acid transporter [Thalassotalea insulae]GLX76961.1 L-methionine/branched-chain amino acid transporter [Thalassotalea insulae]
MKDTNKKIGRWQGAGLLATTLLGTGVFILPQMTLAIASNGALFSWLLLTVAIIPVTVVFALLAAKYPHAGGPAYFVEQAFGAIAGRSIGLIFLLIVPLGVPAAILMTVKFANALMPFVGYQQLVAELALVAVLFLLNYRGIHLSAKVQFLLTLAIITVVVLLLLAFTIDNNAAQQSTAAPLEITKIMAAAGIAFWSFLGVEAMTHLANDFKNPKKDMVPAMLIGTGLVGLIYLGCTWLLIHVPTDSPLAMVGVFDQLLSEHGALVIGILGIAGGLSSANVYTASTIRLIASFSQQGVLPHYFSATNRHNIPLRALVLVLTIMLLVLVITFASDKNLEHLIAWCNGVFVIIYSISMAAALKLLPSRQRPFIYLGFIFCLALAWGLAIKMLYALSLLAIVIPILCWQKRLQCKKKSTLAKAVL